MGSDGATPLVHGSPTRGITLFDPSTEKIHLGVDGRNTLMNEDATALASEASNFERIAGELKAVIAQVEGTAGSLARDWRGQTGKDAHSAVERFRKVATRQVWELNETSGNIHTSGVQYSPAVED